MILSSFFLMLIQIIFVTWFVIRTTRKYSSIFLSKKLAMTKIGTAFLFTTFIISWIFDASTWLFFLPSCCVTLASLSLPSVIHKYLETLCYKGFREFVDVLVLDIKCGKSIQSSFKNQLPKLNEPLRSHLQDTFSKKSFPHAKKAHFLNPILTTFLFELQKIVHLKVNQLDQLAHLQKQIRLDAVLRHKSRQAMLQTRIQAFFLFIIYFCIAFYGLKTYPWYHIKPFFISSFILMALGLLVLKIITRKRSWKT